MYKTLANEKGFLSARQGSLNFYLICEIKVNWISFIIKNSGLKIKKKNFLLKFVNYLPLLYCFSFTMKRNNVIYNIDLTERSANARVVLHKVSHRYRIKLAPHNYIYGTSIRSVRGFVSETLPCVYLQKWLIEFAVPNGFMADANILCLPQL